MAIKFLSTESVDGGITGNNIRTNTGNLFVGNGSNTTANIYGFGDSLMIQGVSGATYLRVSGTATLSGTLQGGQYILATGLAYGAVNSYTQIIDGSTGAITGTTASFNAGTTNVVATFTSTDGIAGIKLEDSSGNVELSASGDNFQVQPAGGTAVLTIDGSNGIATFTSTTKSTRFTSTTTSGLHWNNYTGSNGWQIGADSTAAGMYIYNENQTYCLKLTDAGNATFAGSVTATQFNGSVVITGGTASFVGTVAGATVVSSEGAYAASGNVKLYEAKRSGGAVGGDWSYDDATTDMSLGTNTNHAFALKTNNTRALTIDISGRVGIGTSDIEETLTIAKTDGGDGTIVGLRSDSSFSQFELVTKNSQVDWGLQTIGARNMYFTTNGSERMRIDSSGLVNIPAYADGNKFTITSSAGSNHNIIEMGQLGSDGFLDVSAAGGNIVSHLSGYTGYATYFLSDVGIGVTSPATKLDVRGGTGGGSFDHATFTSVTSRGLKISTANSSEGQNGAAVIYNAQDGENYGSHAFQIGGSTKMFIKGNNVGIGITTPQTTLQVNGAASAFNAHFGQGQNNSSGVFGGISLGYAENANAAYRKVAIVAQAKGDGAARQDLHFLVDTVADGNSAGIADSKMSIQYNTGDVIINNNLGIGTTSPGYNLEIGGTANPKIAITSNINSATSSLYFGDSDATDRGQIVYTHFGDFMELKAGGATRVYIESGINTAYTADGLFNSNATPSYWNHGNGQFKLGYMDNGSGLYSGAYAFNVKSTDGIPVTGREIGAIYINDTSNGRRPLRISNQGRITMDQTNTSTDYGSATGWLTIANGTGAYNFYNAYTGTDGGSGCARYRLNNTSPSFFDFYYTTTQVGYITTNGTDIFYANTSDYRLKEDLKDFNGLDMVSNINVYDFKWKESDNRMYGVVAHELQEVIPQAVVGDKDEEKLQAVDYSKLVPVLIKSIQELEARVKELENK